MKQSSEKGWRELTQLIIAMRSEKELDQFFQLLFTHEERHDLAKRILIIHGLLQAKLPQRELAKQLEVSIAKITRGSNALKMIDQHLRDLLVEQIC